MESSREMGQNPELKNEEKMKTKETISNNIKETEEKEEKLKEITKELNTISKRAEQAETFEELKQLEEKAEEIEKNEGELILDLYTLQMDREKEAYSDDENYRIDEEENFKKGMAELEEEQEKNKEKLKEFFDEQRERIGQKKEK